MSKILSGEQVVAQVPDGATVALPGNASIMVVDHLLTALEHRFLTEGAPRQLTAYVPCNAGLGPGTGVDRLAHEGLLKRYIASAFPVYDGSRLATMILDGKVEAYNFPMGVLYGLLRDSGARRPGMITDIGIGTYVDPAHSGGKMNHRTHENLVETMKIGDKPFLFYRAPAIDVTFLKATCADEAGNLSYDREPLTLGALALATAAKANGGKVFVQVERVVERHTLHPKAVIVPENLVDGIVLVPDAPQSAASRFDPSLTGEIRVPRPRPALAAGSGRVIVMRAAAELRSRWLVNLGVGLPSSLPTLLGETGLEDEITITTEHGGINGHVNPLPIFGAHTNPDAILDPPNVFDMYDGGVLNATLLGMAQADAAGNVNVSKFGGRLMGCGGFIDITARTKNIFFCGTLTTGGLDVMVEGGRVTINREGRTTKFVKKVEHLTFNGPNALARGQNVHIVTERGMFRLTTDGWLLTEIAPGIDPQTHIAPHIGFPLQTAPNCKLYPHETTTTDRATARRWIAERFRRT